MLRQLISEYLINSCDVEASKFNNPDLMVTDLGLDSLGLIEMLFEVEDRYGFQVEEPMRYANMRFDEMVAEMEATVRSKNAGQLPDLHALSEK